MLDQKLLSTSEVAEYLGVTEHHVRNNLKHLIGYIKYGKNLMFRLDDVQAFIDRNYSPAKTENDESIDRE